MSGRLLLVPTAAEARVLLGEGAPPDEEPRALSVAGRRVAVALCGFGPAAAGALAAHALARSGASACVLLGIAGTYRPDRLAVGQVLAATEVVAEVGRGQGAAFVPPSSVGFPQAPASRTQASIGDRLALAVPRGADVEGGPVVAGGLLTVACASATPGDAAVRAARHPTVLGEDMEAFAVALACRRRGVPLAVLRGISNVAGDGDPREWRIADALAATWTALERLLQE